MNILQNATAHFDSIGTKEIKVPEWKTTIYFTPFTLNEKRTLINFSKGNDAEFLARTLIMKSKDKNGEAMFDVGDIPIFMQHVDANVIDRVVNKFAETTTIKEALEK